MNDTLRLALEQHQQGFLDQAAQLYLKVLSRQPNHRAVAKTTSAARAPSPMGGHDHEPWAGRPRLASRCEL
jgi:hypothetical protein